MGKRDRTTIADDDGNGASAAKVDQAVQFTMCIPSVIDPCPCRLLVLSSHHTRIRLGLGNQGTAKNLSSTSGTKDMTIP